jgi:hypothetical protein
MFSFLISVSKRRGSRRQMRKRVGLVSVAAVDLSERNWSEGERYFQENWNEKFQREMVDASEQ